MARVALHHKGNWSEFVIVHSLCNPVTWFLMLIPGVLIYWILSPHHKIKLI